MLSYLDGTPSAYNNGSMHDKLKELSSHMATLKNRSAWALFMSYLGALQNELGPMIFPRENMGSCDLHNSHRDARRHAHVAHCPHRALSTRRTAEIWCTMRVWHRLRRGVVRQGHRRPCGDGGAVQGHTWCTLTPCNFH